MEDNAPRDGEAIRGELVESNKRLRVLKNGAVYDTERGRIVANPPGGPSTAIKSSEQGSRMARRMHELRAIKSRNAVAEAAERRGYQRSAPAAAAALAAVSWESAMDGFKGDMVAVGDSDQGDKEVYLTKPDRRGAVEAGKFSLRLQDMLPEAERTSVNVAVMPPLPVSSAGLAWLRNLLAEAAGQIVEGVVLRED